MCVYIYNLYFTEILLYLNYISSPHQILQHALFVINNLNTDSSEVTAILRHGSPKQQSTKPLVTGADLLSGQWKGPDPLLTSGGGYAYVFPQGAESPIWIPARKQLDLFCTCLLTLPLCFSVH